MLNNKEFSLSSIKTAVVDMDGTIYQLNGDDYGFKNSSLEKKVMTNTAIFLSEKDALSIPEAQKVIEQLMKDGIFPSVYASDKYGISRKDFFDIVWNIDPSPIVINYQEAIQVISQLAKMKIELILLTQSPQIWQNNVFTFLGLQKVFSEIYTGENYMHKNEMYLKIARSRHPQTVLAIGDQLETDIVPAKALGFYTFHVNSPKDLLELINHE